VATHALDALLDAYGHPGEHRGMGGGAVAEPQPDRSLLIQEV